MPTVNATKLHRINVPDQQPQLCQRSEMNLSNYYHGYSVDSPAIRIRCFNTKHGILDATAMHHQRQQLHLVVQGSIQHLVLAHGRWHHHQGFTPQSLLHRSRPSQSIVCGGLVRARSWMPSRTCAAAHTVPSDSSLLRGFLSSCRQLVCLPLRRSSGHLVNLRPMLPPVGVADTAGGVSRPRRLKRRGSDALRYARDWITTGV